VPVAVAGLLAWSLVSLLVAVLSVGSRRA